MTNSDKLGEISNNLTDSKGELPNPNLNLSDKEKIELIKRAGGPMTATSIIKAKKNFAISRIPWLFNSIDSQTVVDLMHNDMDELLKKHQTHTRTKDKKSSPR